MTSGLPIICRGWSARMDISTDGSLRLFGALQVLDEQFGYNGETVAEEVKELLGKKRNNDRICGIASGGFAVSGKAAARVAEVTEKAERSESSDLSAFLTEPAISFQPASEHYRDCCRPRWLWPRRPAPVSDPPCRECRRCVPRCVRGRVGVESRCRCEHHRFALVVEIRKTPSAELVAVVDRQPCHRVRTHPSEWVSRRPGYGSGRRSDTCGVRYIPRRSRRCTSAERRWRPQPRFAPKSGGERRAWQNFITASCTLRFF